VRVRAPELRGRGWLNTGGRQVSLAELRGKIVLLDFWTFCCINCLHTLDELRPLEEKYRDVLVVIGVHSPKFVHEADPVALAAAVERYGVDHPVLDDPELVTWQQYAVRAWPTLVVVDPEGYVVAQLSGEGHAHALDALLEELVAAHDATGTLHRGDGPYVPPPPSDSVLRFPAKAVLLPSGHWLVADAGHHRLAELADDAQTLVRRFGSGTRGLVDGPGDDASFNEPNGLCVLPPEVAQQVGYDVVVADTVNHALRGVALTGTTGEVSTILGDGTQWMRGDGSDRLSSPWDVVWWDERLVVAMAGIHQLWAFDPRTGRVDVLAGTTNEGLVDGPARDAWLAQPSGLAVSIDGSTLWFADSETSSIRRLRNGVINTSVGAGLFDFGHRDGPAAQALLQHPLGVAMLPDASVAVADTYNGALRRIDIGSGEVSTLATDLAEPSGVVVDGDTLLVVESSAHRLSRVRLPDMIARSVAGDAQRTQRPAMEVVAGAVELEVTFTPPPGQKLDDRYGPSTFLTVSASPPELLVSGAGHGSELTRSLGIADSISEGVVHVSVRAASCDDDSVANPACHVHQQDWGVPVRIVAGGARRIELPLFQS
jgi:thiol-disulfide isomerase/thioredoxin